MKKNFDEKVNTKKWFLAFAGAHLFFWTLIPALVRYTIPMDAIEGAIWGQQLALGYDKNPWMNAWLTELAIRLGGQSGWMTYLFSQVSVVLCFWSIWQLGKKILSPVHALIAVFLLELITSFNINAIDFNDNVLELSLWALMILFFYSAVQKQKICDWVLVGVFAGLAMMTKYYVVVLFLPMLLFLLLNRENRKSFIKTGLYIAAIIFLIISLPHFIWLCFHDFITIKYAVARVSGEYTWTNHFVYAYHFLKNVVISCILPLIIFSVFYLGKRENNIISEKRIVSSYSWSFLLIIGFGPLVVTLLYSMISGATLHTGWRMPLFSLFSIILIAWLQPDITRAHFYNFVFVIFAVLGFSLSTYAILLMRAGHKSHANYPAKIIATKLTSDWHKRYHSKLSYVIGDRLEAGRVALYSKDRPQVFIDADSEVSFWINKKDLYSKGALVVWDPKYGDMQQLDLNLCKLTHIQVEKFKWMRDKTGSLVKLRVAFLPPDKVLYTNIRR